MAIFNIASFLLLHFALCIFAFIKLVWFGLYAKKELLGIQRLRQRARWQEGA